MTEGWIRRAGRLECFMEGMHQLGSLVTCYCLTLSAKVPLQKEKVEEALKHLFRKVPTLRLTMQPKDGVLWFREMFTEDIDFEILAGADVEQEYQTLTVHKHRVETGPMWCVRLIPLPEESQSPMPEVTVEFPHQYKLLFGIHHAITDGTSTMAICGLLVQLLNDVTASRLVDDNKQLGYFASNELSEAKRTTVLEQMKKGPISIEEMVEEYRKDQLRNIDFLRAYPPPLNGERKTLSLNYDLSKDETRQFLNKCKENGVTFHAGFCSVINAAVVELMAKAGLVKNQYAIPSYHMTDLRRYWKRSYRKPLGVHLGMTDVTVYLPENVMEDFWNYAREFHDKFYKAIKADRPFVISNLAALSVEQPRIADMITSGESVNFYYGSSNMGNVDKLFPNTEDYVKATHIMRSTSVHTSTLICSHILQTFRGRLLYSLDYVQKFMSTNTAHLTVTTVFNILKQIINT